MLREVILIALLFLEIVSTGAEAGNDVQHGNQLPDGKLCLFTCSEWIFKEKVQKFAPSADLLGPGYLTKHKIGFSNDDANSQNGNGSPMQYQKVWGACYSIDKSEYDNVLKQSQSEYSVPFTSNEDVFVVKYQEMNCLVVDLGIQPGDHPPWRHFNMKIPNTMEDEAYFNRLAQIGVPQDYIKGLRNASSKPKYHPIIPQDYHPRQNGYTPKRTYDQLPIVRPAPNPQQGTIDYQPVTNQIPVTHDGVVPGLDVSVPATPVQPGRKLLPGVVTPGSQPQDVTNVPGQYHETIPSSTVQPVKKLLPGVVTPGSQPQDVTNVPVQYQENAPLSTVQPGPHDVQVAVPKEIDSGVATTPDHQPVVVITPMKLPGSSTVEPVIAKPVDNVPDQSQVLMPGKDSGSNEATLSKAPILTTNQPKEIADTVPTIVTGVAHPPTSNVVNQQTPVDDQSHVVITPLKLSPNKSDLSSVPVGQDYIVQTPQSLKPDDTNQQTAVPKTIDNDSNGPNNMPLTLLNGPKQQTQVGPANIVVNQPTVTQQPTEPGHLSLTPNTIAPPRLQTHGPDLLINPLTQPENEPAPESLPTSYDVPCDHDVPGANSGLVNLYFPDHDTTIHHQNDSPLLTLNNDTPQPDHSTLVTTPGVVNSKPVQQVDAPSTLIGQSPDKPNLLSHQITPNTINVENKPDLLQTNTAPNRLQIQPMSIPASFSVSKPAPVIQDKPMFILSQPNQPNTGIVHGIPTKSSDVSKPAPILLDKPMFTLDQPEVNPVSHQIIPKAVDLDNKPDVLLTNTAPNQLQLKPAADQTIHPIPTSTTHQITPNSLDLKNNPDLLLTNTAPNHTVLQPTGDQAVHSIPASFGVTKPAPVVQDKPMFAFKQTSTPSTTIPATFGVASPPTPVKDKPMFTLDNSPIALKPKHVDNGDSKVPIGTTTVPIQTVDHPHATGLLPNLVHGRDDQPNDVPLTTLHQVPNSIDNSNPALLSSKPAVILPTNNIPDSHTVQLPNPVIDNNKPVTLVSKPDNAPLTNTIPDSHTVQLPNSVVDNTKPVTLASKPDNAPLTNTIPDSHTVQLPNPVLDNTKPVILAAQPDIVPQTAPSTLVGAPQPVVQKPVTDVGLAQTPKVSPQPVQQVVSPPAYTPSHFMAPNYTPGSPALGYTFAYRYPQYLHNCNYKPPNSYYHPDELIPGFTFGSHIQLYD